MCARTPSIRCDAFGIAFHPRSTSSATSGRSSSCSTGRTRRMPLLSSHAPRSWAVNAPDSTSASARSSATGFHRSMRVISATLGNGLFPAVTSGGTTGNTVTPESSDRRAVMTQLTGVSRSSSSSVAVAASSSWLSRTMSDGPAAWSALRTDRSASLPCAGVPKRDAIIAASVRGSHAPMRNQWIRPSKWARSLWPSTAASVDLPLPPAPTSATFAGWWARIRSTSVARSRVRPRNDRGEGGNRGDDFMARALRGSTAAAAATRRDGPPRGAARRRHAPAPPDAERRTPRSW